MWIHIICGAGASSLFVAQRLQRAAGAAGAEIRTSAGSLAQAGGLTSDPDLILLGAHLAEHISEVADRFGSERVAVLPEDAGQDFDGSRTFAFVAPRITFDPATTGKEPQ